MKEELSQNEEKCLVLIPKASFPIPEWISFVQQWKDGRVVSGSSISAKVCATFVQPNLIANFRPLCASSRIMMRE